MRGTQHLHFGIVTTATVAGCMVLSGMAHPLEAVPLVVLGGIGSLLPDIDNTDSKLGRKHPFVSSFIEAQFGHRTITHAVLPWLVALVVCLFLPAWTLGLPLGVLGHLFLDAFTIHGVPFGIKKKKKNKDKKKNIHLLPKAMRCRSGSFVSILYTFVSGAFSVVTIWIIFLAINAVKVM